MFCRNCGKEIDEKAVICPHCGVEVRPITKSFGDNIVDNGGFLWGLLGCCIPIAGLILFLVWKDTKPKTAKAAGIGALVCVICIVLFYAFIFFLSYMTVRTSHYYY